MQRRHSVVGRQRQLRALDEAFRQAPAGGRFALVTGAPGSGRTALLDAAADAWSAADVMVLRVPPPADPHDPVAGFAALLHVLREQYGQFANPLLTGPLSAIGAACDSRASSVPHRLLLLAQETAAAIALICRPGPAVLIADDVDANPGLTPALAAAVRSNCLVVAAGTGTARQSSLADTVVELTPLAAESVREILARRHGAPVDEAVLPALTTALGPLAGNPATILQTTDELAGSGRLVVVADHLCLLEPHAPIPLPVDHRLVASVRRRGVVAVRLATMAAVTRFRLNDLPLFADATLGQVDNYGATLDELVADGALLVGPDDVISPSCPAAAARFAAEAGAVTRLHRAYAAAMLRRAGSGVPADRAALADHVTSAGGTMPTGRRTALALAATAAKVMEREPDRAANWLDAALRHAGGAPVDEDLLGWLMRLLMRTGQFARLAEVVRAAPADRADLPAAGVLAAVHAGVPVAEVLSSPPDRRAIAPWADRWLTPAPVVVTGPVGPTTTRSSTGSLDCGPALVTDAEFALVGWAVDGGDPPGPSTEDRPGGADRQQDQLLAAGAAGDLAQVFHLVLGTERYRIPADGPLAAYHRMLSARTRGDLPGVVSAARQVQLTSGRAPALCHLARIWAAESLGLQGRCAEAATWLSSVPDEPPYAALRWWVTNGLAGEPGTTAQARHRLDAARRARERQLAYGSRIGVAQLIVRAAGIAGRFGLVAQGREIVELVDPAAAGGQRFDLGTALLAQALAASDLPAAAEAIGLLRGGGDRVGLAYAALDLGRIAADPLPWLLEALHTAEEIRSPRLRAAAVDSMRARGVRRSRGQTSRAVLSAIETEIIALIRSGRTNRQIAVQMRMSEKTVENYLTRLFARTGCRSRVELVAASITSDTLDIAS
ncbi:helix-turn-helix transcriptional regulator [Phytohabitans kaempferiae]|uniref:LuxR C-terminal-related transcriptional regulator n=1 Tax=Phytohabitans kaempferiae TaxID=1620943 RepID=A0ABV6M8G7_9ACTN